MKKIILSLLIITGFFAWNACEKEEPTAIIDLTNTIAPSIVLPTDGTSYILLEDNADEPIVFDWTAANYNMNGLPDISYTLLLTYPDSGTVSSITLLESNLLTGEITTGNMNDRLVKLGMNVNESDTVIIGVRASMSVDTESDDFFSQDITLYFTTYEEYVDSTAPPAYPLLYVPGDYQDWDPASAPNLASLNDDGKYEGYVNFPDANTKFKFTSHPDWTHTNFGDGGDGILDTDDEAGNLTLADAGYYRFTVDTTELTWEYLATSWGLIGSALPNGWDSDEDMTYDTNAEVWTITIDLTADEIKIRANDDWAVNFGDNGADGTIEQDGANITVPEAGNYTVVFDLTNPPLYGYSLTKN